MGFQTKLAIHAPAGGSRLSGALGAHLALLRKRLLTVGGTAALAWALAAVGVLWLLCAWLDLVLELSPALTIPYCKPSGLAGPYKFIAVSNRSLGPIRSSKPTELMQYAAGKVGTFLP